MFRRMLVLLVIPVVALAAFFVNVPKALASAGATVKAATQRMTEPSLNTADAGTYGVGTQLTLTCYERGQAVQGYYSRYISGGWDNLWYQVKDGYWVADVDIDTGSNDPVTPACAESNAGATVMATTQRMSASNLTSHQAGTYGKGLGMALRCFAHGQSVKGYYSPYISGGWDNLWYMVTDGYWVADVDINTGTNNPVVRPCGGATAPTPPAPAPQHYNRAAAVAFARAHWNDKARFSEDCTWFMSEILWQGGLPKSSEWTDRSFDLSLVASRAQYPGPTMSAAVASLLKNYLVNERRIATLTPLKWTQNSIPGVQIGDIIAYDWGRPNAKGQLVLGKDGIIDHLMVVTNIKANSYAEVTGHTQNTRLTGWSWSPASNNWWQVAYHSKQYGDPQAYLIHITY